MISAHIMWWIMIHWQQKYWFVRQLKAMPTNLLGQEVRLGDFMVLQWCIVRLRKLSIWSRQDILHSLSWITRIFQPTRFLTGTLMHLIFRMRSVMHLQVLSSHQHWSSWVSSLKVMSQRLISIWHVRFWRPWHRMILWQRLVLTATLFWNIQLVASRGIQKLMFL